MMLMIGDGYLVEDPKLEEIDNGEKKTYVVKFKLGITEYINSEKKYTHYLPCEAWDSGAKVIAEQAKKGDTILIQAIPRQHRWKNEEDESRSRIVFRVKEFRIFKS